jgi:hypothetical protein
VYKVFFYERDKKMKKIIKYSTILGTALMLSAPVALSDTGGYVRVKGFDSHFHSLGFSEANCGNNSGTNNTGLAGGCKLASKQSDKLAGLSAEKVNTLNFGKDDGEGLVVGADYGFFRLEVEGTWQDAAATNWRGHAATGGTVYQARLFANVVVEPFDLLALLGEYGGVEELVKYNPAHYGISPYAMYGYGVMGGLLTNLSYTRNTASEGINTANSVERGAHGGGAMAAVNVGAGVNIGLDQLARGLSGISGASLPEYFKLPIELSVGYHWQVGLDDLLFESMDEDIGIDDGGLTYSIGLKW